jgi:enhancing lycopene biosynthesis protein 2
MNKRIAVILSGCGVFDGSEIYESVLTLLRLDQNSAQCQCFAPDMTQHHRENYRDTFIHVSSLFTNVLSEMPITDFQPCW